MGAGVEEQALDCFPNDVDGGEKQQGGFDEGRETFDLAVAVKMVRVGRAYPQPARKEK